MKALMHKNLVDLMEAELGRINLDDEALTFYRSIAGKEVELVFVGPDAFEKNDNKFWLPDNTWTPLPEGDTGQ